MTPKELAEIEARADVSVLVAEVRRLEAENAELKKKLAEWEDGFCFSCGMDYVRKKE
jgi:cell division protein FtsB